ncbi:hypothetical protein DKX38_019792 [Salix brachista]|uniref:Endonuclease/exonuclease/phosphatase domain-containing protein n=1 Tax=Salix brachista TaxID=2182728 RepID=A0A5N5KHD2_9ROSI|nr:hypothetical protein DKX38_019792 [Salix brachista]
MVMTIGTWNIRGLNSTYKQNLIQQWVTKNSLNIIGILEPRILPSNMEAVEAGMGISDWHFLSNIQHDHLCRILVGKNSKRISVTAVHKATQWITCDIKGLEDDSAFRVTFVYRLNTPTECAAIWSYLIIEKTHNTPVPWGIMGDFNAIMSSRDRQGGDSNWYSHMKDYPNYVSQAELIHLLATGMHYTWHNGRTGDATILKKHDWAWGNQQLLTQWKPRFKFLNLWTEKEGYEEAVTTTWNGVACGSLSKIDPTSSGPHWAWPPGMDYPQERNRRIFQSQAKLVSRPSGISAKLQALDIACGLGLALRALVRGQLNYC